MDADLSTDLAVPALADRRHRLGPGRPGHRQPPLARRHRHPGAARELISQSYNLLVRTVLQADFHDAQCGFKALRRDLAVALLPHVADQEWFFDTELLLVAQRRGLRIAEVPVTWVDDPDSSVHVLPTALADLRGVVRMAGSRRTARLTAPGPTAPPTAGRTVVGARRRRRGRRPAPAVPGHAAQRRRGRRPGGGPQLGARRPALHRRVRRPAPGRGRPVPAPDALAGGDVRAVRMLAVLAGLAIVAGTAAVARAASGSWRAGAAAAWLVAVLSSSAAIEGYAANGELLAGGVLGPGDGRRRCRRRAPHPRAVDGRRRHRWPGPALDREAVRVRRAGGAGRLDRGGRHRRVANAARGGGARRLAGARVRRRCWPWPSCTVPRSAGTPTPTPCGASGPTPAARSPAPSCGGWPLTLLIAVPLFAPAAAIAARRGSGRSAVPLATGSGPSTSSSCCGPAPPPPAFFVGGNYHRHYWIQLTFPFAVLVGTVLAADTRPGADRRLVRSIAAGPRRCPSRSRSC